MRNWEELDGGWRLLQDGLSVWLDKSGCISAGRDRRGTPAVKLTVDGRPMTLQDLSFVERGDGGTPSAHSLQLVFADHGIRVRLYLSGVSELPILLMSGEIENIGEKPFWVDEPGLAFAVPKEGLLRVRWTQGVCLEEQQTFPVSFLTRHAELSHVVGPHRPFWLRSSVQGYRPTSSNRLLPWCLLQGDQQGYFTLIQWSGQWVYRIEEGDGTLIVNAVLSPLSKRLDPGGKLSLPKVAFGRYQGSIDHARGLIHRYLRRNVMPPAPDETFPWVQFNSWYPWTKRLDQKEMLAQLDVAAELGCEVFVLDDGWFLGSGTDAHWGSGAGHWVEDPAKFPMGLREFGRRVKQKGLRFGLWVEPERVAIQVIDERPEIRHHWLAYDGDRLIQHAPNGRVWAAQICFGCPEAVAWAKQTLSRVIEAYEPDWIKWDHNIYGVCTRGDHGHQEGDGNEAHIRGVYEVLEFVRDRYPDVVIENCASGGARVDPGMMAFTHVNWLSDLPAPSYRARSQFAGALDLFPPEYLNSWVIPHREEPLSVESARYLLRSRMLGAFGISYPMTGWSDELKSIVKDEIAHYKRLRDLMRKGSVVPVFPQETTVESWAAFEYWTSERGAVLVFRNESPLRAQLIPLKSPDPVRQYVVTNADTGVSERLSGEVLRETGLTVALSGPHSAALYWVEVAS